MKSGLSTNDMIEGCFKDDNLLEAFGDTFFEEFKSDDASYSDKYGRLLSDYGDDDNLFITLTGWSLETLLKMSRGEEL